MCLTIPGRVVQVNGAMAEVELDGRTDWYNALAQPEVKVGDFVLTHANLIVSVISEDEAQRMLQAALADLVEAAELEGMCEAVAS